MCVKHTDFCLTDLLFMRYVMTGQGTLRVIGH